MISCLSSFLSGFGQVAYGTSYKLVDRHCSCPEFVFREGAFQLTPIRDSNQDIEIRLRTLSFGIKEAITVIKVKGNSFSGNFYNRRHESRVWPKPDSVQSVIKWEKYPFKKYEILDKDLDSALYELIFNNVLKLPNQRDLPKNKGFVTPYTIVFKYYGHFGSYTFGNPTGPSKDFPNIQAYKDYAMIIQIFKELTSKIVAEL